MTTLDDVASFTLDRQAQDFPETALASAKLLLLDTLGIAAGATVLESGSIARELATTIYAAGTSEHSARLMFDGRSASLPGAAYAAATQIDNLDGHDGYNPTKGHIGVVAVPTLFALADQKPGLSGRNALAALVVGYEIAGRAAIALHTTVSDYHTSGAWNALGVAAMASRLRCFTKEQLRQALGIAEYHGPRSQMMREINNPTMLHDGSGWGALVGLSAAISAEIGFTGAPAVTVESTEVEQHWADLGEFWQVEHQYIKPYPICRWAHPAIDATRALTLEHGFTPQDIMKIEVNCFDEAAELFAAMPNDTSKAQYSLPFSVATMAVYGEIKTEHVTGEGLSDPVVASLVARTKVEAAERHSSRFPQNRWSDVRITLRDGTKLESGDVHARGGPEHPFTEVQIKEKFMQFATPTLGNDRASALLESVMHLSDENSVLSSVDSLLYEMPSSPLHRRSA